MPADEIQALQQKLADMERRMANMGRMGRVKDVQQGRVLVSFGKSDGGDSGTDDSVWIRTAHGGAESTSPRYAKGETVHVWSCGGNHEHSIIHKAGFNDKHPRDANDTDDNSTKRWRKKPDDQKKQDQQGQQGGKQSQYEGEDQNDAPQWKDDKDDHQEIHDDKMRKHMIGDYSHTRTKEGGVQRHGKVFSKVGKDGVQIGTGNGKDDKDDQVHFVYKDGKLQVKCDIVDKNGNKFAVNGTKTNKGDTLTSNFANE